MSLDIQTGIQPRAQKVVIYGAEGIGKSTLASKFPDPLFIDLEGGTSQLDVKRIANIKTWAEVGDALTAIIKEKVELKTLVIDTADAAENLARAYFVEKNGKEFEEVSYGAGYPKFAQIVSTLISSLDVFVRRGINVVVLAHAKMRKFEQPDELGAYDRWELKLSRNTAPLFKEWADMVLFCNFKTDITLTDSGKARAAGGRRVIYAAHHPCWDAKNRHGLPDSFDMDYEILRPIFEGGKKA